MHSLIEHLILGSILASLIVWLFIRNWRAVLIAAVAIPASIISTFTLMRGMDFSLNNITLLALTLAVGIVIDDAIIVLENIFRFMEEKGRDRVLASIEATKEIGLAVMATTLSLVIIFLPIAFMTGFARKYVNSFGWTMAMAILVSLLVAGRHCDPTAKTRREALKAAYRATHEYETGLLSRLISGLQAIPGIRIFGITDSKRFDERCSTLSFRLGDHNPTAIATFLGDRGIFTWDGNFYALNLSERLGVEQKGGVLRVGLVHYNTADEVDRLLTALREFSAESR